MTQVLVIDDEEVLARTICTYLGKKGIAAGYATSATDGVKEFELSRPSMTLLDYRLGEDDGLDILRRLRTIDAGAQIVMLTGHGDIGVAVEAMKAGARDFLAKPAALSTIANLFNEVTDGAVETAESHETDLIVGRSSAVEELRRELVRIADAAMAANVRPPPVLIIGETGTGKELIARTLHRQGPRAHAPFISINCGALPGHLVEAELFGYERGAFTDAKASKPGLFEAADGGVLFLDEVSDTPLHVQAKLLRVLEEQAVRRIGSLKDRAFDTWVISAANRPLSDLVRDRKFRADLMFRLQVLSVEAPPLRCRHSDVLVLANHFLIECAERYGRATPRLSSEARAALVAHTWPGNVRELRNVIESAVVTARGDVVENADLRMHVPTESRARGLEVASLPEMERDALANALVETGGNVTRAAKRLGITRDTLRYRIRKFGLHPKR